MASLNAFADSTASCPVVDDEQAFAWIERLVHRRDLVHEFPVDHEPSGGVDYHGGEAFGLGLCHRVEGYLDGILLAGLGIYRYPDLLSERGQLVDRRRPERVAGCEQHLHP